MALTPVEQLVLNELKRIMMELMILGFVAGAAMSAGVFWLFRWLGW
jgi:hypothetical protein